MASLVPKSDRPVEASASSALDEDTSRSLAATLRLARAKGYIDHNKKQQQLQATAASTATTKTTTTTTTAQQHTSGAKRKKVKLEANSYTIEERREDKRDRHHHRNHQNYHNNRSRGGGGGSGGGAGGGNQLREVRDSEDYKPEINLEYTDDAGRKLETPKDAFRYMCYKFHGKGPGKNKIDKRLRKQELESKIKQTMSTDVPASASLMISKQKELQTPYIVLSKGK